MNHLDNDWQDNSFWDRWRMMVIFGVVILVMGGFGAFFLGADGIMRLTGLIDDSYQGALDIRIQPADAILLMDYQSTQHPVTRTIEWSRPSDHVFEITHPAYQAIKIVIHVPESSGEIPVVTVNPSPEAVTIAEESITIDAIMKPEFVPIEIRSKPSGASIAIDGMDTGKRTPMTFELPAGGSVRITVHKEGFDSVDTTCTVPDLGPGEPVVLVLKEQPKPREPQGKLLVKSPYPVTVLSGSKQLSTGKKSFSTHLKPGRHTIRTVNTEYLLDQTDTITIRDNQTSTITVDEPGTLIVESEPSGADVTAGSHRLGKTPGTFSVAPGLYNIELTWSSCDDTQSQWVKILPGQTRRLPRVFGCR
ncbi:PEGA domain-containing protein [bacterium]|nr:PEGA domain-containing protein [candidate division CSSED10-310 bacterium]